MFAEIVLPPLKEAGLVLLKSVMLTVGVFGTAKFIDRKWPDTNPAVIKDLETKMENINTSLKDVKIVSEKAAELATISSETAKSAANSAEKAFVEIKDIKTSFELSMATLMESLKHQKPAPTPVAKKSAARRKKAATKSIVAA